MARLHAALLLIICCIVFAAHAQPCDDIRPPGNYTCAQQKAFGACTRPWMTKGVFCKVTCGVCNLTVVPPPPPPPPPAKVPVAQPPKTEEPVRLAEALPAEGEEQESMLPTPLPEPPAALGISAPPPTMEQTPVMTSLPRLGSPAAEQNRDALTAAAAGLTSNAGLTVQPTPLGTTQLPTTTATPTVPEAPPPSSLAIEVNPATAIATPTVVTPIVPPATPPAKAAAPAPLAVTPPAPEANATAATDPACNATGTVYDVLLKDDNLSDLRQAVDVLGFFSVFQRPDVRFTLFAPTNQAFEFAAAGLGTTVNGLIGSKNALREVVLSHVVPNAVLTAAQLQNVTSIALQSGTTVFVVKENGELSLVSTGATAKVTNADYAKGCNYAVHIIDIVLQPNPSPRTGINPQYQSLVASG